MIDMDIKRYDQYNENEIMNLYKEVGWSNYYQNPSMLQKAYENSLWILGAYKDGKLIGIIRVVGDRYSIIYIQDIIVIPAYQRKKVGSSLLNSVLDKYKNVYQKVLMTDNKDKTIKFYESIGFSKVDKYGCTCFVNYTIK